MSYFITGFILGISQIAAIGMQNAFILNNGLRKRPMLAICALCSICDIIMILFGVLFAGYAINEHKVLILILQGLGVVFLFCYGIKLLYNAIYKTEALNLKEYSGKKNLYTIIVVSILNPHAWVDAFIVIGSVSTKYFGIQKFWFTIGCIFASITWFLFLGYGSKRAANIMQNPKSWQKIDLFMSAVMLCLAYQLFISMKII